MFLPHYLRQRCLFSLDSSQGLLLLLLEFLGLSLGSSRGVFLIFKESFSGFLYVFVILKESFSESWFLMFILNALEEFLLLSLVS